MLKKKKKKGPSGSKAPPKTQTIKPSKDAHKTKKKKAKPNPKKTTVK
jgi:hypothetical protein